MLLNVSKIKNAKPNDRDQYLKDGNNLWLLIKPNGSKLWRYKRTVTGKQIMRGLGKYPEVSLAEARDKCSEHNKLFAKGLDPLEMARQEAEQSKNTFEILAREWHGKQAPKWCESHSAKVLHRLEREIFPYIGNRPMNEIQPQDILRVLRIMENRRATDLAHRMHQIVSQVFRFAIASGKAERDNAADLRGALTPVRHKHHASLTKPKEIAGLLRAIDEYQGSHVVRCALRLSPLLFVRPGELRHAEWPEIDYEAREWRIPAEKMKMKVQHIVPLSTQALAILEELKPETGHGKFLFPGRTLSRPMSENTIGAALRYLGFSREQQTAHGFRSMASTRLNEMGWNKDAIERQLAHSEKDRVRAAYNHADYLDDRRKMMQAWADYLDQLKQGAKIIPLDKVQHQ